MSRKIQIACASSGILFVALLFGGIVAAGWFPPIHPDLTAEQTAAEWASHTNGIRLASVLIMFGAGMTIPFLALQAAHVRRMEGGSFTPLAWANLAAGTAGVAAIFMPAMIFAAASYRPERSPEITQALSDLGWIPFIMNGPPAITQAVTFGIAVLIDRNTVRAFPRWMGYYSFWVAFCFLPACILPFFKTGPFAWNGLLSFWLAAVVFGTYFIVMTVMMIRASKVVAFEEEPASGTPRADLVGVA